VVARTYNQHGALITGQLNGLGLVLPPELNCFNPQHSRLFQSGPKLPQNDLVALAGPKAIQLHWTGPSSNAAHKNHPYFCPPDGWIKFGIRIASFDEYNDWPIVYHGTKKEHVQRILEAGIDPERGGLKAGPRAAHGQKVYVSPSIIYSSHPTYATWWHIPHSSDEVQVVLMCRVAPGSYKQKDNTLRHRGFVNQDPNWPDTKIEWIVQPDLPEGEVSSKQLKITGMMYRKRGKA